MQGTITRTPGRGVTLHTYSAPGEAFEVTTHLIELESQVVAVDAQFGLPHAREVTAYAAELVKPISRLYITHAHPDHYLGAAMFDVPRYALAEVQAAIAATGDDMAQRNHAQLGDFVPRTATVPERIVTPGVEMIDGIDLHFDAVEGGESALQLTVAIPDADAVIVQDLVYNGLHPFVAEQRLASWRTVLDRYAQLPYTHVLPGHGLPGGKELYGEVADYLEFAEQALASAASGDELIALLTERFPHLRGTRLLEIQNHYLFAAETGAIH